MTVKLTASMMVSVDGVPGAGRSRRGPARRVRARRVDGCARRRGDVAIPDLMVRARGCIAPWTQDLEIWEPYWPLHDSGDPVSHGINVLPKHVPSTTLVDPTWQNTHVIDGDLEAAVRELKAMPGRELQVHGSGVLLRWLLERDLVDELNLRIYPVIVGDGLRLRGAWPDARPGAGRVALDVEGRDDPDLSTGRPPDLRDRRLRATRPPVEPIRPRASYRL